MSSLLQFQGEISPKGVRLELYQTQENPRYPGSAICGEPTETRLCAACNRLHPLIYRIYRKPKGMLGCWVIFRWNNEDQVPDLSHPVAVFKLPKDAKAVYDEENAVLWHRQ